MASDTMFSIGTPGSNPFGDLSTMLERFEVPGVDMSSFIDARRRDVQALVDANKAAYEAMQALARTQADMLSQAMRDMQESARVLNSGKTGVLDAARHAEEAHDAWKKMLADMNALAEMARKSQVEAVSRLSVRTNESSEEVRQTVVTK